MEKVIDLMASIEPFDLFVRVSECTLTEKEVTLA